jgi:hypothetical protein
MVVVVIDKEVVEVDVFETDDPTKTLDVVEREAGDETEAKNTKKTATRRKRSGEESQRRKRTREYKRGRGRGKGKGSENRRGAEIKMERQCRTKISQKRISQNIHNTTIPQHPNSHREDTEQTRPATDTFRTGDSHTTLVIRINTLPTDCNSVRRTCGGTQPVGGHDGGQ